MNKSQEIIEMCEALRKGALSQVGKDVASYFEDEHFKSESEAEDAIRDLLQDPKALKVLRITKKEAQLQEEDIIEYSLKAMK